MLVFCVRLKGITQGEPNTLLAIPIQMTHSKATGETNYTDNAHQCIVSPHAQLPEVNAATRILKFCLGYARILEPLHL